MKKINLIYWVSTALFCFMMAGSAIPNIISDPVSVKGMHEELGYPVYIIPFLGVAKLLGVAGVLVKGFPRLKEWAYAGLFFDLIGAQFSILAIGKPDWVFLFLPIALGLTSYIFHHRRRKEVRAGKAGSPMQASPLVA